MPIGNRIKEVRASEGLSMEAFGKRIDMVKSNISRMEKEQVEISDRNLKLISNEFNVNIDWLRTGEGEMYDIFDPSKEDRQMELAAKVAKIEEEQTQRMIEIVTELEEPFYSIAKDLLFSLEKHSID